MVYSELVKKACNVMFDAHKDDRDKGGYPYAFHPFHLAEQMKTESETVVALLHDVVEDTEYTLDDIRAMGFPEKVTDALALLTHDKSVLYLDYVVKIKENPIASAVKLADLKHNSDLSRLDSGEVNADVIRRVQKYADAVKLLTNEDNKTENLHFWCYLQPYISLSGKITDGCLSLQSGVSGEFYDSDKEYYFSKEATLKLFSLVTLKEFIALSNTGFLIGLESFFKQNGISYHT